MRTEIIEILQKKYPEYCSQHIDTANDILSLFRVIGGSDEVVVELSDEELKIITGKELEQWQKDAIEFDGFEGWIVKGKLVKRF